MLRAVGEPSRRFAEDYLRVLRAFRFAGAYDLEIEPETLTALRAAVVHLDRLSAERVREELLKVLSADVPSPALRMYSDFGALDGWYPEIAPAAEGNEWADALEAIDALRPHRTFLRVVRLFLSAGGDPRPCCEGSSSRTRRFGAARTSSHTTGRWSIRRMDRRAFASGCLP